MQKYPDIKLAYPVVQAGANADIMGMKALQGYDEVFVKLHQMGYRGVELQVRNPAQVDVSALETALNRQELRLVAIGTSPMQKLDHLFLLDTERDVCTECFHRAQALLQLCSHFHVPMLIGKMRGNVKDMPGCQLSDLQKIIAMLVTEASDQGVQIAIEPQNISNINNLNTFKETMSFINSIEATPETLGIHADLYHMKISEPDMLESIRQYGEHILFIHIADTDRRVPGDGDMDYARILTALQEADYRGFLSPEIKQLPDSETAAERSIAFFDA